MTNTSNTKDKYTLHAAIAFSIVAWIVTPAFACACEIGARILHTQKVYLIAISGWMIALSLMKKLDQAGLAFYVCLPAFLTRIK